MLHVHVSLTLLVTVQIVPEVSGFINHKWVLWFKGYFKWSLAISRPFPFYLISFFSFLLFHSFILSPFIFKKLSDCKWIKWIERWQNTQNELCVLGGTFTYTILNNTTLFTFDLNFDWWFERFLKRECLFYLDFHWLEHRQQENKVLLLDWQIYRKLLH